jgi:hypothetical protein
MTANESKKSRFPRFSVRQVLLGVAIVALFFWQLDSFQRDWYRSLADYHARQSVHYRELTRAGDGHYEKQARWHAMMARRNQYRARHRWFAAVYVPPDPVLKAR